MDAKHSIEVRDPSRIAWRYVKGKFFIDFISSVPFTSVFKGTTGVARDILDSLGLLKLFRITRLLKTVTSSNLSQDIKVYLKIIMMAIVLFVIIHVLSCIWFSITFIDSRWVQNMDFMYAADDRAYQGFWEGDENFWRKYLVMLYTGFYIFGVGEIVPRTSILEFLTGFILCSLCTLLNAVVIGYMVQFVNELNTKTEELNRKLNLSNTAMLNLRLSPPLKSQIKQYIYQTHTTLQLQSELNDLIDKISPVYQRRVTKETFTKIVKKNSVLNRVREAHMEQRRKKIQARNLLPS